MAGLIEGDGNIWTSKTLRSAKGWIYNRVIIAFHVNEMHIFQCKDIFGAVSLYREKGNNSGKYTISYKNTLEVINLINGKFRTVKIKHLHRAIDHINLIHNTRIKKLPLDNSNLGYNPWLAGFTDADGNFIISLEGVYGLNNSKVRGRVMCTFSIMQRVIDKPTDLSCLPFMTEIANFFQCKIIYKSDNALTFLVQADSKHYLTKSYLNKYPLMTSKRLNYLCFLEGLNYLGKRLTDNEIRDIQALKLSMNNKRTYYDWNHLKNLDVK